MIRFKQSGNFNNTERFFKKTKDSKYILDILNRYGREGVTALSSNTPVDSGITASSWDYKIEVKNGRSTIYWTNSNINEGVPIAVILQYGHGTNGGGYVRGIDYINPAMRPIFEQIANKAWKEVTSI